MEAEAKTRTPDLLLKLVATIGRVEDHKDLISYNCAEAVIDTSNEILITKEKKDVTKFWGYSESGRSWLRLEEAAYLVQKGSLKLFIEVDQTNASCKSTVCRPVTIQEILRRAWEATSFVQYRAFCVVVSNGLVLQRMERFASKGPPIDLNGTLRKSLEYLAFPRDKSFKRKNPKDLQYMLSTSSYESSRLHIGNLISNSETSNMMAAVTSNGTTLMFKIKTLCHPLVYDNSDCFR